MGAGEIVGDGFSVAWRVLDAQYWGVPQRRRRIYLVADFAGGRAGKILFERESLRGHPAQGGAPGQGAAADAARSAGGSRGVRCLNPWDSQSIRQYAADGVFPALAANNGGGLNRAGICFAQNQRDELRDLGDKTGAQQPNCVCYDARGNGDGTHCPTLTGDHENRVTDYTALCIGHGEPNSITMAEQANTLTCMHDQQAVLTDGKPPRRYIIRRLTPLECNRLQGFPEGWGIHDHKDSLTGEEFVFWMNVYMTYARINGKKPRAHTAKSLTQWYNGLHTDSAEYKMWGNGIALPCAEYVMEGIAEELKEAAQCTKA